MVSLETNLNGLILKNPIIAASGTYGYNFEYTVFNDVKKLGAIVTKGVTLEVRGGNQGERLFETYGGMINRIGLENIGIYEFLKNQPKDLDYILNIAGACIEDYVTCAKICEENHIKAIELNVSCPNVKAGCMEFGTDENLLYDLIKRFKKEYSGYLIIKLTPNVTSPEKIAQAVQKAGADAISAINTVKGMGVKLNFENGRFLKSIVEGGLSGKCIKPIALSFINRISKVVNIPIIGMGGIYSLNDVFEFLSVGASAVEVGTANFTKPDICSSLVDELELFMQNNNFKTIESLCEALRNG